MVRKPGKHSKRFNLRRFLGIKPFSIRRIVGLLLILAGIGVVSYIPSTWIRTAIIQHNLRGAFEGQSAAALALNQSVLDNMQSSDDVAKLRQLAEAHFARLNHLDTVADLIIPKIGQNVIVVEGTDEAALKDGAGHMSNTPLPGMGGNFVVGGDRVLYGAHFLNLDDLENGDQIIVRTQYAEVNYAVVEKKIVEPDDTSTIAPLGYEGITLFTCDPPWGTSHRLIIVGKMTSFNLIQTGQTATATTASPAA